MKIGLFYGTNTGVTEIIAEMVSDELKANGCEVDLFDIANVELDELNAYDNLIIATPTWNDGELQDDWEEKMHEFVKFDFSGKKVAFVGTGDQEAYCDNYLDAIGVMAKPVRANGGTVVGRWKNEGYNEVTSVGLDQDNYWVGLALDQDNQESLTEERIKIWSKQVIKEFSN